MVFSANFINEETHKLYEFRQIYRQLINLLSRRKDLRKYILADDELKDNSNTPAKNDIKCNEINS